MNFTFTNKSDVVSDEKSTSQNNNKIK